MLIFFCNFFVLYLTKGTEVVHEAKVPVTDVDFSVNLAGDGLEAAVVGICSNFDVTLQNSAGKTIKKDDLKVVIKDEAGQPIDTSVLFLLFHLFLIRESIQLIFV